MSEQPNSSNQSRRQMGVILLAIGVFLLAAQFLMAFIAAQREKEAFAQEFDVIGKKINAVVAREVAMAVTADAGPTQEFALEEEVEPDFEVKPAFVFVPAVRTQLNVLGAFRVVGSLVAFIFLGAGVYILSTRKETMKMDDPRAGLRKG